MASEQNASEQQHEYGASDITVLEGLEAVRKRPGMYIGSTTERSLHHLVYEVVDNSVDEALVGYASKIDVTIQADGAVRVRMMAAVFPWMSTPPSTKSTVEVVMTVLHAGGKFGGGGYSVSGGLHGVGISVVNALSTRGLLRCTARATHGISPSPTVVCRMIPCAGGKPSDKTGTIQTFYPDPEIFETVEFDFETLRARFQQMAFLNKGLTITLTDERRSSSVTRLLKRARRRKTSSTACARTLMVSRPSPTVTTTVCSTTYTSSMQAQRPL